MDNLEGNKTNKEIILEIYESVYRNNNRPRPLDYARAIYDYRHKNDDVKEKEWNIKRDVETKRTTVMKALKQLTEGDNAVLGVIDKFFYVPKKVADEYNSRLYLLENLHIAQENVLMISEKVWVIALAKGSYANANDVPIDEKETEAICPEIKLPSDKILSPEIQLLLNYINELKDEIHNLRNEVQTLCDREKRRKAKSEKIKEVIKNLRLFIGEDYYFNIYREHDNIVILLNLPEHVAKVKAYETFVKINKLLKDIWNKPAPRMRLTKKE